MRKRLAALVAASVLVLTAAAEAAPSEEPTVPGASASQSLVSKQTMKSTLRKDLRRALARVRKLDLATVESKGFRLKRIRALVAGKASFVATARSRRTSGQATAKRKLVTVTKGSRTFAWRGKTTVRLKITKSGKKLLKASSRITLRVKATFTPLTGGRVTVVSKVTLKRKPGSTTGPEGGTQPPAVPIVPIPTDATPLYSQNFEGPRPWGGLFEQCADSGSIEWVDADEGFARLVLPADAVALPFDTNLIERCELSHGGYDATREPGEYWYHAKIRLRKGFPHEPNPMNWTTIQQWQEDRPTTSEGTGRVDGAMLVNSGSPDSTTTRMYLHGEALNPLSQGPLFDKSQWVNVVVKGVWTDQPTGYLEWYLGVGDAVPALVGTTSGITSQTGGRHFWKGGITRAGDINTDQIADIAEMTVYRR